MHDIADDTNHIKVLNAPFVAWYPWSRLPAALNTDHAVGTVLTGHWITTEVGFGTDLGIIAKGA